jgi:Family of unknown function (DUF6515)
MMKRRLSFFAGLTNIILIMIFAFTGTISAQKKVVVVKHGHEYKEIVVKERHYFYKDGFFYDKHPEGYVKIVAPIGARITVLPSGYKIVRAHRIRYYVFGGIYYRYLPRERIYEVVKAPL